MGRKDAHTPEEIVATLRQAEVLIGQGKPVANTVRAIVATTACIEKASPRENGYVEPFNGKLRGELFNGEVFKMLREARVLIEAWRRHCNRVRTHSPLGYRLPAPETAPMAGSLSNSVAGTAAMAH